MLTPEQDNPDYKLLYQSLMKQKAELVEQHRLLGNHVKQQNLRIADLERERDHWKANHENQVRRARILLERPDMPIERVKAYRRMQELEKDAARYRQLRRGQQWSVIDGIGDVLRADDLDAAIDITLQPTWPEDTSDYGSRITPEDSQ